MPQIFHNEEIYNQGKVCNLCNGLGFLDKREGLTHVICRICYGLGKRDRKIENKSCLQIDFNSAILTRDLYIRAKFSSCNFHGCCLREVKMTICDAFETIFTDTNFCKASIFNCNFSSCHFPSALFVDTKISNVIFLKSDLWHANFYGCTLASVRFEHSAFQSSIIKNCALDFVEFKDCHMKNITLIGNVLNKCFFNKCNLDISFFENNELIDCDFTNCTFFSSNIITSIKSIDLKKKLLSNNRGLAI